VYLNKCFFGFRQVIDGGVAELSQVCVCVDLFRFVQVFMLPKGIPIYNIKTQTSHIQWRVVLLHDIYFQRSSNDCEYMYQPSLHPIDQLSKHISHTFKSCPNRMSKQFDKLAYNYYDIETWHSVYLGYTTHTNVVS